MAYVCHAKRLIFVAVPKTGTTSVLAAMNDLGVEMKNRHERASEAKRRLGGIWHAYEKFGFVREPCAWAASYYRFLSGRGHPISSVDKFLAWTPTPYDWLTDKDGVPLVTNIWRTEDMAEVMQFYGLSVHHRNKAMNKAIAFDLDERHAPIIREKFKREFAHYG